MKWISAKLSRLNWRAWILPMVGLFSLLWFLVRVIPKPSRATDPCQRAAFPVASGFMIWVHLQGGAEDYLHEAALANAPPSGTFYDPGKTGTRLASLGAHEHWNNSTNKQYSRNLGAGAGIELVALTATRPDPVLTINKAANQAVVSWQGSLTGFRLQSANVLSQTTSWTDVSGPPVLVQGRNTITNVIAGTNVFYRLTK